MKYILTTILACVLTLVAVVVRQKGAAQTASSELMHKTVTKTADAVAVSAIGYENSAQFITEMPRDYRDWKLISVAREEGNLDDIRAVLGNDIAIQAYREGTRPFPEGTMIARLAWSFLSSEENNKTFGTNQSFVAGPPKNGVQFMIKDSKKYATTGGWGYGHFDGGTPANASMLKSCFACHKAFENHDFIFTNYAP